MPHALREVAVLVEPLSIAVKAEMQALVIQERTPFPQRMRHALVIGAGPVGILAAMAYKSDGFDTYVYSAEPASSDRADLARAPWERGSNENFNGLLRQHLPKGSCMRHVTQAQCDHIADDLNNRPRKRLKFKTPADLYHRH